MDTCKIAPGLYQYTAIDDCTQIRVLALYKRRSAANSQLFLEWLSRNFPFRIQRIPTDRGREFFAYAFQEKLMEYGIKFRPLKPASPHLNPYASHCTSLKRCGRTEVAGRRSNSLMPCAFLGMSAPTGSYSCSGLSV